MPSTPQMQRNPAALASVTLLFFIWGFVTSLNDVLQPILQKAFSLSHTQANFIPFAFFTAYFTGSAIYFILSLFIGDPMNRMGYKNGMIAGLLLAGGGCALFYPAAVYLSFPLFLTALFTLGGGLTLLQIAANPYVTLLGPAETASSRLNLSQAFNSFGTTVAPITGGYAFYHLFNVSKEGSPDAVKFPYLILAGIMALLAFYFLIIRLPSVPGEGEVRNRPQALKHSNLTLGMVAIFFYVGAEVAISANFVKIIREENVPGFLAHQENAFVSVYWGGAMIGRFLGSVMLSQSDTKTKVMLMLLQSAALAGFIMLLTGFTPAACWMWLCMLPVQIGAFLVSKGSPSRALVIFALGALLLLTGALFTSGYTMFWLIVGVGLFNSIMWSNIFSLGIAGLGSYTGQGSSLLVMMILGGALLPLAMGALADQIQNLQMALIVPLLAYFYLIYYGVAGYKAKAVTE